MRRWRKVIDPDGQSHQASLLAGTFLGLAVISHIIVPEAGGCEVIRPANAAITAAVLLLRGLPVVTMLGACLGLDLGLGLARGPGGPEPPIRAMLDIAGAVAVALLSRRSGVSGIALLRPHRLARFCAVAFGVAALGALIAGWTGPVPPAQSAGLASGTCHALADGLGLVIGVPAILALMQGSFGHGSAGTRPREVRPGTAAWLLPLTGCLAAAVFGLPQTGVLFVLFPALIMLAFRVGQAMVLLAILVIALTGAALTAHGYGPIAALPMPGSAPGPAAGRAITLQLYVLALFMVAVPTRAVLCERAVAVRRLRRLKEGLQRASLQDPLTRLANRKAFEAHLGTYLRRGVAGAVLFIDVDRFKEVNDTLGHPAGDRLLAMFAGRLRQAVAGHGDAFVARFGGDEFMALVPGPHTSRELDRLCTTLLDTARRPYGLSGQEIRVNICIGAVAHIAGTDDAPELVRRADVAMYSAKHSGRDGYRVYHEGLDRDLRRGRTLQEDLHRALAEGSGLALHYQPKLDRAGALSGVEALLRWTHPQLGPIPANHTIQAAEMSGLIVPLGAWTLREAAAFSGRWPGLRVAVNVSPLQLEQPRFAADVLGIIEGEAAEAARLELEITEMALERHSERAGHTLLELKRAGFGIALDDFGTGYSSFVRLHRFPVDRVKIDQSFVQDLGRSTGAGEIIRAIVHLGHAMGLQVTAEGVETQAHRAFLTEVGVDELQGYLLALPMAEADLAAYIEDLPGG